MTRRIIYFILIVAAIFVLMDIKFLWKNLVYTLIRPEYQREQYDRTHVDQQNTVALPANILEISSLGIITPIIYVDETSEAVFQKALQDGVVHYPNTADPGGYGNVYIFGHSSDYPFTPGDYKTVFALLPRITKDTQIVVTDKEGHAFTYIVTESFVAEKSRLDLLDQHNNQKRVLTLQTSYPLGTALKRYIVIAEIQE
jgi:LPXTG-site transpeptidase (sortase) family protein